MKYLLIMPILFLSIIGCKAKNTTTKEIHYVNEETLVESSIVTSVPSVQNKPVEEIMVCVESIYAEVLQTPDGNGRILIHEGSDIPMSFSKKSLEISLSSLKLETDEESLLQSATGVIIVTSNLRCGLENSIAVLKGEEEFYSNLITLKTEMRVVFENTIGKVVVHTERLPNHFFGVQSQDDVMDHEKKYFAKYPQEKLSSCGKNIDFNLDGIFNYYDYDLFKESFFTQNEIYNLNCDEDGIVNVFDFAEIRRLILQ